MPVLSRRFRPDPLTSPSALLLTGYRATQFDQRVADSLAYQIAGKRFPVSQRKSRGGFCLPYNLLCQSLELPAKTSCKPFLVAKPDLSIHPKVFGEAIVRSNEEAYVILLLGLEVKITSMGFRP
jgi:hypothetical protein